MVEYDIESLKNIEFDSKKIGIMLIESITSGLYKNPKNAIREYIQNEFDARAKEINIETLPDTIAITGDSDGMTEEELKGATNLGISYKTPGIHVGFRGIGIWSGISICEKIVIFTKRIEETIGRVLVIDAKGIMDDMKDPTKPLMDSLSNRVFLTKYLLPDTADKHGTRVELRKILPYIKNQLSPNSLEYFITQVAPIPISPNFSYSNIIEANLSKHVPGYRTVMLCLNKKQLFRPPYESEELSEPIFFNLGNPQIGYGWYSISSGILPDHTRFLIFKNMGFTVGDENRANLINSIHIADITGARWISGEVHVISNEIRPTSERNEFESSIAFDNLKDCLTEIMNKALKSARERSYSQSAERRLEDIQKFLHSSPESRDEIVSALSIGERLIVLAEGDVTRERISTIPTIKYQSYITQLKQKRDYHIKLLGGPIEDRPLDISQSPTDIKPGESTPMTDTRRKRKEIMKREPKEYMKGLQGIRRWRSEDLELLETVLEAMNKVFKEPQINKWIVAFRITLRNKIRK